MPRCPCCYPVTLSYGTPPNKPDLVTGPASPCCIPPGHMPLPSPKIAKSCSLFRAELKCHLPWEGFPRPSSKENSHPSCWLGSPGLTAGRSAELSQSNPREPQCPSLRHGGKSPVHHSLEEFNKGGTRKAPKHSEGTQLAPGNPWWKPALAGQACRELGGCVRHPFHLFSVGPQVPAQGHCQPTAHWSVNSD